jgi:hypothetical protein
VIRSFAVVVGIALSASSPKAMASEAPCELHVWAASHRTGKAIDPRTFEPIERSAAANVLDPGQRLYEIDPRQLVSELSLPADTKVTIHFERLLNGKEAEKATKRLDASTATCYFDWTMRGDSMFGPPPKPTVFFTENHGQSSFYSMFKAYGPGATPWFEVRGVHRGHLPVLEGPDASKRYVYDTAAATTQFFAHAAEKIRDKLKGRSLISAGALHEPG